MKIKNDRNVLLYVLAIIAIFIISTLIAFDANAQTATLRKVKQDQEWYSFERWRKDQPKMRVKQVKYAVEVNGENSKEIRKKQRLNRKIEAIRQKIK